MDELEAADTPLGRRIEIVEALRDAFSTLAATPGRFEVLVPALCQVGGHSRTLGALCFRFLSVSRQDGLHLELSSLLLPPTRRCPTHQQS